MPRPNPEAWSTPCSWTSNYAGSSTAVSRSYHRTYTSVNSPGFPVNMQSNPHTMELIEQWNDPSAYWSDERVYPYTYRITWAKGPMYVSARGAPSNLMRQFASEENVKYRARSKLAHAVKRDEVNLAVSLAESSQAFRMFGSTTTRIANAYRALRRGDIRGLRRSINVRPNHAASLLHRGPMDIRRHAPQMWLELQYGWKPLLSDMYGAVTRLHQRVEEGYPIRARASASETLKRVTKDGWSAGIVAYDVTQVQRNRVKYMVDYWVDGSLAANLNDWGLTNPLEVVWELVPYSFVVDWFIPVGDYLSTFDAYLGVTFKQGFEVIRRECQSVAVYKPVQEIFGRKYTARGVDSAKHATYQRNVLGTFPGVGLPRFKNPFTPTRAANAISLLSLAFDRRR